MTVDGRAIAEKIKEALRRELQTNDTHPSLGVIMATDALATKKFVERKRQFGEDIGVSVDVRAFRSDVETDTLAKAVNDAAEKDDGVVVQLPLPAHVDVGAVLNAIPASKDVDAISDEAVHMFETGESEVLPPVVGAIAKIAEVHNVAFSGKRVAVIGSGRLVGKPAAAWARQQGADVRTMDVGTSNTLEVLPNADIIVSGAGVSNLIRPDMVKDGVVIFDAGTSEAAGRLTGDADPACAKKASLFTPVPGGIGPITVAMIFINVVTLAKAR